jgi:hypothetical protein
MRKPGHTFPSECKNFTVTVLRARLGFESRLSAFIQLDYIFPF